MKNLTQRMTGKTRAALSQHKTKVRIHRLAGEILLLRGSEIAPGIDIHYDTSTSPPAYGNFMEVVMLCRYLIEEGYAVRFELVDDPEKRRQDWSVLEPAQQQRLLLEFKAIANKLIPAPIHERLALSRARGLSHKVTWYRVAPYLIHLLYEKSKRARANSFLLTMDDFAVNSMHPSSYEPYVAWHIRHNLVWGGDRNSTRSSIISDFLALEKAFPERAIVILSTPDGVAMALDALAQEGLTSETRKHGAVVRGQKEIGFLETIPVALGAEFYFQRLGGGMGIGPIFSSVPYLQLNSCKSYYFNHTGTKLVSWATSAQRYVVRKDAGSVAIEGDLPSLQP